MTLNVAVCKVLLRNDHSSFTSSGVEYTAFLFIMKDFLRMIIYIGWAYSASAFSTSSPVVGRKIPPRLSFSTIRSAAVSPSLSDLRCILHNSSCCALWIKQISGGAVASMFFVLMLHLAVLPAFADEYGVEKEAPTIFTGETVEVRLYISLNRFTSSFFTLS